jgi:hypothetical protein
MFDLDSQSAGVSSALVFALSLRLCLCLEHLNEACIDGLPFVPELPRTFEDPKEDYNEFLHGYELGLVLTEEQYHLLIGMPLLIRQAYETHKARAVKDLELGLYVRKIGVALQNHHLEHY